MTFGTSSVYQTCARKCASASSGGCASLANVNKLTMNGTIEVTLSKYSTLGVGDSIRVFEAKTVTGTPKFNLPDVFIWDTSRISEGLLFITGQVDVNSDGVVDTQDVLKVYDYIRTNNSGSSEGAAEDVNGDGTVDSQDVLEIYESIKEH